jgi:hypothetical protein
LNQQSWGEHASTTTVVTPPLHSVRVSPSTEQRSYVQARPSGSHTVPAAAGSAGQLGGGGPSTDVVHPESASAVTATETKYGMSTSRAGPCIKGATRMRDEIAGPPAPTRTPPTWRARPRLNPAQPGIVLRDFGTV